MEEGCVLVVRPGARLHPQNLVPELARPSVGAHVLAAPRKRLCPGRESKEGSGKVHGEGVLVARDVELCVRKAPGEGTGEDFVLHRHRGEHDEPHVAVVPDQRPQKGEALLGWGDGGVHEQPAALEGHHGHPNGNLDVIDPDGLVEGPDLGAHGPAYGLPARVGSNGKREPQRPVRLGAQGRERGPRQSRGGRGEDGGEPRLEGATTGGLRGFPIAAIARVAADPPAGEGRTPRGRERGTSTERSSGSLRSHRDKTISKIWIEMPFRPKGQDKNRL